MADIAARHLEPKQSCGVQHPPCSCSSSANPEQAAEASAAPSSNGTDEQIPTGSASGADTGRSVPSADTSCRDDRANGVCGEPSTSGRTSSGGLVWTLPAGVSEGEVTWLWVCLRLKNKPTIKTRPMLALHFKILHATRGCFRALPVYS